MSNYVHILSYWMFPRELWIQIVYNVAWLAKIQVTIMIAPGYRTSIWGNCKYNVHCTCLLNSYILWLFSECSELYLHIEKASGWKLGRFTKWWYLEWNGQTSTRTESRYRYVEYFVSAIFPFYCEKK